MSKSNYSEQMTQAEKLYSMHSIYTIQKIPEMCYELSGNILSLILKNWK